MSRPKRMIERTTPPPPEVGRKSDMGSNNASGHVEQNKAHTVQFNQQLGVNIYDKQRDT